MFHVNIVDDKHDLEACVGQPIIAKRRKEVNFPVYPKPRYYARNRRLSEKNINVLKLRVERAVLLVKG